jgi:hypothetical protein
VVVVELVLNISLVMQVEVVVVQPLEQQEGQETLAILTHQKAISGDLQMLEEAFQAEVAVGLSLQVCLPSPLTGKQAMVVQEGLLAFWVVH